MYRISLHYYCKKTFPISRINIIIEYPRGLHTLWPFRNEKIYFTGKGTEGRRDGCRIRGNRGCMYAFGILNIEYRSVPKRRGRTKYPRVPSGICRTAGRCGRKWRSDETGILESVLFFTAATAAAAAATPRGFHDSTRTRLSV